MEDIGPLPFDSKSLEIWIHRHLKDSHPPDYIADELIKRWERGQLTVSSKQIAGRFCFLNGFYLPVIRVIKKDLRAGGLLPWALIINLFVKAKILDKPQDRELIDAILAGATRDKRLNALAAEALRFKSKDPRWPKILEAELNDRYQEASRKREKLFEDIVIFQNERMHEELKDSIEAILAMFPNDREALKIKNQFTELDLDASLSKLRKEHDRREKPRSREEDEPQWPGLHQAVDKIKFKVDLEGAYNFAIGLYQMGFYDLALLVLRCHQDKWNRREWLVELEFMIAQRHFAEALEKAQTLMQKHADDPVVVQESLYISAKAYHGLDDHEQAVNILRGLLSHHPEYRDASLLLADWGKNL